MRELIAGSTRFNELQKGVPLMSPTLLSTRLKQLVQAGVITRSGSKGNVTYMLTAAGLELQPIVEFLGAWGHRWVRSDLGKEDLDAGLLMWDMRRSVDPAIFPGRRVVVQFEYPDAPKGVRDWWLISENGDIDLCLQDPGYDIDILIKCSLATMIAVWTCQLSFKEGVKKGDIKALGDSKVTNKLQDWLRSSLLSRLGSINESPKVTWNLK